MRRSLRPLGALLAALSLLLFPAPQATSSSEASQLPATSTRVASSAAAIEVDRDGLFLLDADAWPRPDAVDGAAWILVDVDSGQVLAAHQEQHPRPVASTTKLLTALAVVAGAGGDELVTISAAAAGQGGASSDLAAGEQVRIDDLLALLLLRSGNDAAVALAEHVSGTVEQFAVELGATAGALGIEAARLVEPHGLDDRNRLTARQLAVVGRAVLAEPRLRPLVAAATWTLHDGTVIENRNELLSSLAGATGLKTGMTTAAGWSVVASAQRQGRHLLAVVLAASSDEARFTSAASLLEHGFANFAPVGPPQRLQLRGDARWLVLRTDPAPVQLPRGADGILEGGLPVEVAPPTLLWSWTSSAGAGQWRQAARWQLYGAGPSGQSPEADHGSGNGGPLGAWLSGRVQAALRAAAVRDLLVH